MAASTRVVQVAPGSRAYGTGAAVTASVLGLGLEGPLALAARESCASADSPADTAPIGVIGGQTGVPVPGASVPGAPANHLISRRGDESRSL